MGCSLAERFFPDLDALGDAIGVHKYSIELFFFMYQAWFLRERYAERNLPETIFFPAAHDSLKTETLRYADLLGEAGVKTTDTQITADKSADINLRCFILYPLSKKSYLSLL